MIRETHMTLGRSRTAPKPWALLVAAVVGLGCVASDPKSPGETDAAVGDADTASGTAGTADAGSAPPADDPPARHPP